MTESTSTPRITIRVSKGSLCFAQKDTTTEAQLRLEPFVAKSGVAMAANLREAFKTAELLQRPAERAQVLVDSPTLLIPIEEYKEAQADTLYMHAFPQTESSVVMTSVLPDLNVAALYAVNKDLKLVVDDHFRDVRFSALMRPVWSYLHRRGMAGERRKVYAYFHDGAMDVFAFERHRFLFSNQFPAQHTQDCAYFLLFIWKQLALHQHKDELYIVGQPNEPEILIQQLKEYVTKVSRILPSADFNRAPMTMLKGMTFDLAALYLG